MEMIAVGPIFPEEKEFTAHRPVRDRVAALETALAAALRERGYTVLGTHPGSFQPDGAKSAEVLRLVEEKLRMGRST
jgi:hypothetical protein